MLTLSSCVSQIHSGVNRSEPDRIRSAIEQEEGALEERNVQEETPLISAARQEKWEIVRLLVEEGADINAETEQGGLTALRYAIMAGNYEMTTYLIENGADVSQENEHGWTPLHTAARYGHMEILNFLIQEGADINARTDKGVTPTRAASDAGYTDIVVRLTLLQQERQERANDENPADP